MTKCKALTGSAVKGLIHFDVIMHQLLLPIPGSPQHALSSFIG